MTTPNTKPGPQAQASEPAPQRRCARCLYFRTEPHHYRVHGPACVFGRSVVATTPTGTCPYFDEWLR